MGARASILGTSGIYRESTSAGGDFPQTIGSIEEFDELMRTCSVRVSRADGGYIEYRYDTLTGIFTVDTNTDTYIQKSTKISDVIEQIPAEYRQMFLRRILVNNDVRACILTKPMYIVQGDVCIIITYVAGRFTMLTINIPTMQHRFITYKVGRNTILEEILAISRELFLESGGIPDDIPAMELYVRYSLLESALALRRKFIRSTESTGRKQLLMRAESGDQISIATGSTFKECFRRAGRNPDLQLADRMHFCIRVELFLIRGPLFRFVLPTFEMRDDTSLKSISISAEGITLGESDRVICPCISASGIAVVMILAAKLYSIVLDDLITVFRSPAYGYGVIIDYLDHPNFNRELLARLKIWFRGMMSASCVQLI